MQLHGQVAPAPPAGDDRPAWAAALRMPTRETLTYAQALLVAGALAFVAVYMTTRAMSNPDAVLRAARAKTGV